MSGKQLPEKFIYRSLVLRGLLTAAVLLVSSSLAFADELYWVKPHTAGDWSTSAYWGGTVPTMSDDAYIVNGGTANITLSGETCMNLYLGGASSGTVNMTAGGLSDQDEYVGYSGTGTFTQSGGTNSISSYFYLGYNSGVSGTYNLNSTGQLIAPSEYIGYSSSGTFTQTGGTNTVTALYLGYYYSSSGTYKLSGAGQLSAGNEYIGNSGTVTFTQDGGNNSASYEYVGYSGTGTYTQTGGTNSITSDLYLGYNSGSSGTYNLSGGTNTISSTLYLGYNSGSSGMYNLSGTGYLSASNEYIGYSGTGSFKQDGGMHSASNEYVGYLFGTGTYTQTGGTNSISSGLCLANMSGYSGFYNLSGTGYLYAYSESIGLSGTGTFTQTGGTNSTSSLGLANGISNSTPSVGIYNLSGTGYLSAGSEYIGQLGIGTFTQTGGTNNATYININATSTYTLSAGTLTLNGGIVNQGVWNLTNSTAAIKAYSSFVDLSNATLTNAGNVALNLDSHSLLIVPMGLDSASYFKSYANTGLMHQSGSTLNISSAYSIYGIGSINGHVACQGTLAATTYYSININGGLTISGTGSVNLGNWSSLYINDAPSGMDSGSLSSYYQYIGSIGTGTFSQTGGTNTTKYIKIYASGTYTFTAGTLIINGGIENQGVWDLSNSSAVINASSSIVDLSNATLTNAGNVSWNLDAHSLLIVPAGFDPATYFKSYANTGLVHQSGSTLNISTAYSIYGIGSINDHVVCQGTLGSYSTYFINLNGGLTISGTGSVNLGSGTLYVNDAISGMDGGSLSSYYQYVGSTGTGTFTQSGGTNSSYYTYASIYLGYNPGASGTYNLSGTGNLSTQNIYVGYSGTGTFMQTGGSNSTYNKYVGYSGTGTYTQTGGTNSGYLYLGYNSGASGIYNLSGSGQLSAYSAYVGYSGVGTFTQTGGTISGYLYLGYNPGASGTYNLSSPGKMSAYSEYIGYSGTGTFTQDGGSNSVSSYEYVGYSGIGTYTQTGGTNSITYNLYLGYNSGSSGTYNLNGGTLILKSLSKGGSGTAAFNFGGGTLQASGAFTSTLPLTLTGTNGNANVNTNSYAVALSSVLSGDGGLNKLGSGTLTLSNTANYGGNTTVNGGTLIFAGGIGAGGTTLIDVESGTAILKTVNVSKNDLDIYTAAAATFEVADHTHMVGDISGSGITQVDSGVSLTAASIRQGTLTIGSGATVTIQAIAGGPLGGTITPVPEPGAWVLLATACLAICVGKRMRRNGR
ncbi:MAG: autotransporter-associated beta strand repeat-containing protein [Thermoguttaceae bacterium]